MRESSTSTAFVNDGAQRVPRTGPPPHANTQREHVLEILREAGSLGVRRDKFLFFYRITQCGARISELQEEGFQIASRKVGDADQFVTYFLRGEPTVRKYVPRYTRKQRSFQTEETDWNARPRAVSDRYGRALGPAKDLPLFSVGAKTEDTQCKNKS